ncbi:hypothetical protein [Streptodolium elevatio]|uniref:Uncharacterized protein n=1 Tax=Streptodolium elevatio TaxID=3157996 RepID=A0ABV3DLB8_9ACTN
MADESKSASAAETSVAGAAVSARKRLRPSRITIDVYRVGPNGSTHIRSYASSMGPAWTVAP